jgi:hypothetical protein
VGSTPLLAFCAIMTASALAGCAGGRMTVSDELITPPAKTPNYAVGQPAKPAIGEHFASVALDDNQLGGIRGGLSTGSGLVVNFSFQEATYVNHNLAQSIAVPTITVSPNSNSTTAFMTTSSAVAPIGNTATQLQASSPTLAIQSILNNGMTSVVSNLGGGGVTNSINNTANNQLVQQMITANIGITGLSQALQQNVASTVASRLSAANSQFR